MELLFRPIVIAAYALSTVASSPSSEFHPAHDLLAMWISSQENVGTDIKVHGKGNIMVLLGFIAFRNIRNIRNCYIL